MEITLLIDILKLIKICFESYKNVLQYVKPNTLFHYEKYFYFLV